MTNAGIITIVLALSLFSFRDTFGQDFSAKKSDSCMNVIKDYSKYWIKDSLADNGFRELLGYRVLGNCKCKGQKWKEMSEWLGKPDFINQKKEKVEYRYRLNRYVEDIKHPGTLLLDITVNVEGIVTSFVVWEVDG